MKKILLTMFLWCNHITAGTLSCDVYYADSVAGITSRANDAVISYVEISNSDTSSFEHSFEIIIPDFMVEILDGYPLKWSLYLNGNIVRTINATHITMGTNSYTHTLYVPSGEANRVEVQISNRVQLNTFITPEKNTLAQVTHKYKDLETGQIYTSNNSRLRLASELSTSDSITFQDRIELGTLSKGKNISETPINYQLNTHNIPIYFRQTSVTPNSTMNVNGSTMSESIPYNAPIRVGLSLLESAQPGIYTSTVDATWTCP